MARRFLSESGYYHIVVRSAGQVALFEDDDDRRKFLRLLKNARNNTGAKIIAWVLMSNHVHLVVDFGERPELISTFMLQIDSPYSRHFNAKTGREGTLFQGGYWSKPILNDAQLIATVYYIHMNPEAAGIARMREYHWSSYQEYAGTHWTVDTDVLLELFGGFEEFDAYRGSEEDVVADPFNEDVASLGDADLLALAMKLAGVDDSSGLRTLQIDRRDDVIYSLHRHGVSGRKIARTLGIGPMTVSRVLRR